MIPQKTIERLKRELEAGREDLARRADALGGIALAHETSAMVDRQVRQLVLAAGRPDRTAIVALGGYGRSELCPYSDLDLLFLVGEGPSDRPEVRTFVDAILYGLWDLRFEVGQAVRTVGETLEIATRDQSVMTSLLDARAIDDGGVFGELAAVMENELFTPQRVATLIKDKLEEAERRRARFLSSVYLLEPNVKESEGGLRELHTAMWIARARWRVKGLRDLLHIGVLSSREQRAIERAYSFLLRVRAELHRLAKRRQDILGFQYQEAIAAKLGFKKHGVERFMRAYYFSARQLRILSQSIIERATSHHVRRAVQQHAPEGFKLWQGMLTVAKKTHFEEDPTALMRIFKLAQDESREIYSYTKDLIHTSSWRLDAKYRRDPSVVGAFLALLEDPKADGSILDLMHDLGVLRRFIPEVSRMTARWQRSLYHVYTVDAHSLFVVKNLKRLRTGGFSETEQEQEMTRLMGELPRPVVLYMAAFLHDIGKGWRQGDHSERGAVVAEVVGRRFEAAGLAAWTREDTQDLVWLVKEHLMMSTMSQRRDVADRGLLMSFADAVKTVERLTMLYLLTFADMRGTSPKVWTEWKGSLLSQLHHNARAVLVETSDLPSEDHELARRRRAESDLVARRTDLPPEIAGAFTRVAPTRYITSFPPGKMAHHVRMWLDVSLRGGFAIRVSHKRRDDVTELTVACTDRPRLLALLAGTLAANSLQILSAQIFSVDAYSSSERGKIALDILYVKDADGTICDDPARWERVREDLSRVFEGRDDVEELIDVRVRGSILGHRHRPEVETKLVVANEASETETVIDVFCQDHLGALYTICKALSDQGLSISLAKISTEGNRVADGFYVTDARTGAKIVDPVRLEAIKESVKQAIDRHVTAGGG